MGKKTVEMTRLEEQEKSESERARQSEQRARNDLNRLSEADEGIDECCCHVMFRKPANSSIVGMAAVGEKTVKKCFSRIGMSRNFPRAAPPLLNTA